MQCPICGVKLKSGSTHWCVKTKRRPSLLFDAIALAYFVMFG